MLSVDSVWYDRSSGLKKESVEKLKKVKPATIGQAMRISGITPADVMLLLVETKKRK